MSGRGRDGAANTAHCRGDLGDGTRIRFPAGRCDCSRSDIDGQAICKETFVATQREMDPKHTIQGVPWQLPRRLLWWWFSDRGQRSDSASPLLLRSTDISSRYRIYRSLLRQLRPVSQRETAWTATQNTAAFMAIALTSKPVFKTRDPSIRIWHFPSRFSRAPYGSHGFSFY